MIEEGTYKRRAEGGEADKMALPPKPKLSERPEPQAASTGKKDDEAKLKEVYDSYINEMKKLNVPTDKITFDLMKKAVGAQKKKAEERYGTKDLNFKIKSEAGKVKIQIIPKK